MKRNRYVSIFEFFTIKCLIKVRIRALLFMICTINAILNINAILFVRIYVCEKRSLRYFGS